MKKIIWVIFFVALFFSLGSKSALANLQGISPTAISGGWGTIYTMGYRFTPTSSGNITALWCYGAGSSASVRLWSDAGATLATATVNCNGAAWGSTAITPVAVTAGTYYRVSAWGANYYANISVPSTNQNITIDGGYYSSGSNVFPTISTGATIYGMPDVTWASSNTAPSITNGPLNVAGGSYTRLSANNTTGTFSFTATDAEQTGANQLTYYIHTGANRTGTQVGTGTFTSGVAQNPSIAYNANGIVNGNNILYFSVYDGIAFSGTNPTFSLQRDDVAPTASTSISHTANPVASAAKTYTVTFTPNDAVSTGSNEMSYYVRTAAAGGGTLLTSGVTNSTSGTPKTTGVITDSALPEGSTARYIRTCDGANNCTDTSFNVNADWLPTPTGLTPSSAIPGGAATITWNPVGGATGYYIRINENSSGSGHSPAVWDNSTTPSSGDIAQNPAVNSYNYTFQPGTSYNIWVHARDNSGNFGDAQSVTFTTYSPPSGGDTENPTNLNSYFATLNAVANPNGIATFGHFRVFLTNPGNCNSDSGGMRFPEQQVNDIPVLPTDSSVHSYNFTIPLNGGSFLEPGRQYWYCSYAINASGTGPGTVKYFPTPDGPASPCDPPSSGNLTVPSSSACTFNGAFNGVDTGSGTKNNGVLTVSSGSTVSIAAGQQVAYGSLALAKGASITMARGGMLKGGPVYVHDNDRDNVLDDKTQYIGSTPSASGEFVRRNTLSSIYNYGWKMASSGATLDCNPTNANVAYKSPSPVVVDTDNDGYKTAAGAVTTACVGTSSVVNTRTYFKDTSNASTWLPQGAALGGGATDCQDVVGGAPCDQTGIAASGISQTQTQISWSNGGTGAPTVTSYNLLWCDRTSNGACTPATSLNGVNSPYTHSDGGVNIRCGRTYAYIVRAFNGGASTDSAVYTASTNSCVTAPSITAQGTSGTPGTTTTFTSSVNGNGAATTITYRYATTNAACNALGTTFSGTQTGFSGSVSDSTARGSLTGNTTYYYCATANNAQGTTNGVSNNNTSSNFLTAPGVPGSTSATGITTTRIDVSWAAPSGGATSYNLKWCYGASCNPGSSGTNFGTINGVTSVRQHTGLVGCGTTYRYIVTAVNATGSTDTGIFSGSTTACYSYSYAQGYYYGYAESYYYSYSQAYYQITVYYYGDAYSEGWYNPGYSEGWYDPGYAEGYY